MPQIERKIRVLFLPKWYPNRYDPMPGLFIQRQAEALTPFCDVAVVYLHPDPDCPNESEVEFSTENEVRVLRVYYRPNAATGLIGRLKGLWRFYRSAMKAVNSVREFKPDLVHAHILTRMGMIGWRAAKRLNAPLVISEHWSRYFPENGTYGGWFRKRLTGFITGKAEALIAVSGLLRDEMQRCGLKNRRYRVVPNVVDSALFSPRSNRATLGVKTMVHISCFEDRSKNISGFLRSLRDLSAKRRDFRCLLVGEGPDWVEMKEYAASLGLSDDLILFTGLKTGEKLAGILSEADFSVLSSRYETFGTVIAESLSCGVPVVSTRVGVAPEIIGDANGLLVPPGDEQAMATALDRMLDRCRSYDRQAVAGTVEGRFSTDAVGRQILGIYNEVLSASPRLRG